MGTGNIERGPGRSFYLHDLRPDVSLGVSRSRTSVTLHAVLVLKTRYTGTCRMMVAKVGHVTLGSPAPPCWCPVSWPCSRHSCPCGTCCIHRSARHSSRWYRFSFIYTTRQAPRQFIGPLRLWSSWGLSIRDTQFFSSSFFLFVLKHSKNIPNFFFILFITNCCILIVSIRISFLWSHLYFDQNLLPGQCPVCTQWKLLVFGNFQLLQHLFYCFLINKHAYCTFYISCVTQKHEKNQGFVLFT